MLSLHVLAGPKHHALQHEWVRRMRTAPRELRRAIDRFGFAYRRFLPNFLYPDPRHDFRPFAEELSWLGSLDAPLVALELTRPFFPYLDREQLSDAAVRRRALAFARRSGAHVPTVALAFDEPEELRDGFVQLVAAYWEAGFAAEWERLEPLLAESVVEAGRRIAADGVYAFLVGLAPALRVDLRREEFGFDLPHDHVVPVTEESELVLVPERVRLAARPTELRRALAGRADLSRAVRLARGASADRDRRARPPAEGAGRRHPAARPAPDR